MKCQYRHCNRILINVHGNSTHCNDDCTYAEKLLRQRGQYKKKKLRKRMDELNEIINKYKSSRHKNISL
jgi:hypothetical protein